MSILVRNIYIHVHVFNSQKIIDIGQYDIYVCGILRYVISLNPTSSSLHLVKIHQSGYTMWFEIEMSFYIVLTCWLIGQQIQLKNYISSNLMANIQRALHSWCWWQKYGLVQSRTPLGILQGVKCPVVYKAYAPLHRNKYIFVCIVLQYMIWSNTLLLTKVPFHGRLSWSPQCLNETPIRQKKKK